MLTAVRALAADLDRAWRRAGYERDAFGELAADLLDRPLGLDVATLARGVCGGVELPRQRRLDQGFGQPAITLHHGERFVVEALCWHTGSPAIHQHAFTGAFRVVTGRSVHGRYSFTETGRVEPRLAFGDLRLDRVELLDDTVVTAIPFGARLVHSAFHLDDPSMTVVVRTHDEGGPEYSYLPPGVAFDPAARSPALHKRLQLLDTLHRSSPELYAECVHAAIDGGDLYDAMAAVMRAGGHALDGATFGSFVDHLVDRHGPPAEPLVPALAEERRRGALVRLRASLTDADDRHLVACLISFRDRASLLDQMVRYHGDPAEARRHLASGVAAVLRVPDKTRGLVALAVSAVVDDGPADAFPDWAARRSGPPLGADDSVLLAELYPKLLDHPLLLPLRSEPVPSAARRRVFPPG